MDWDEFYQEKVSLKQFADVIAGQKPFLQKIEQYAGGKRLLEGGVGTGIISTYLSTQGYKVFGIDKNSEVVRQAKSLGRCLHDFGSSVHLLGGDIFCLPFSSESFDLCFHQGVLEHFNEDLIAETLREQLRVSRTVVFSIPSEKYPQKDFGDENLWSVEKWERILNLFEVIDVFGYNIEPTPLYLFYRSVMPFRRKFISYDDVSRGQEIGFVVRRGK